MAIDFLTAKEAKEKSADLTSRLNAKGIAAVDPFAEKKFVTPNEARDALSFMEGQLSIVEAGPRASATPPPLPGAAKTPVSAAAQAMLDAAKAKAEAKAAEERAKAARAALPSQSASAGGAKAAPRSTASNAPRWDRDARVAEGKRLLALPRDSAEITNLIKEALDIHKGVTTRQRIVDMVMEQAMQAGLYARFYEVMKLTYSVGPKATTPYPPPPTHEHDMSAADLLALSTEAKASLADRALREEQGRLARVEIKRAFASASPAQQSAMRGAFGKVLDSHK
ncbi:MAG TPA: hypothetical protein VGE67_19680, partial [Haloferula sp.]